jgi:dimeric dUTPase (all-alpha-NTP-PPase superfamily)
MYTLEVVTVYIYIYKDMYKIEIREKERNSHINNQFLLFFMVSELQKTNI